MDIGSVLKSSLVAVRRGMKAREFSAKGTTYHRRTKEGNTLLVSVQKSRGSTASIAEVTLNYGVYSARLGYHLEEEQSSALDVTQAHWRKRLSANGREKWLQVHATDSAEDVATVILEAIDGILPDLLRHASDEALRDEWLARSSPGITEMQRLLFAAILVNEIGPAGHLGDAVQELKKLVAGGVQQQYVELRLAKAGVRTG